MSAFNRKIGKGLHDGHACRAHESRAVRERYAHPHTLATVPYEDPGCRAARLEYERAMDDFYAGVQAEMEFRRGVQS